MVLNDEHSNGGNEDEMKNKLVMASQWRACCVSECALSAEKSNCPSSNKSSPSPGQILRPASQSSAPLITTPRTLCHLDPLAGTNQGPSLIYKSILTNLYREEGGLTFRIKVISKPWCNRYCVQSTMYTAVLMCVWRLLDLYSNASWLDAWWCAES